MRSCEVTWSKQKLGGESVGRNIGGAKLLDALLEQGANGTVCGNESSSDELFFLASAGLGGAVGNTIARVCIFADGETAERGIADGETADGAPTNRQATEGQEGKRSAAESDTAPTASPPMRHDTDCQAAYGDDSGGASSNGDDSFGGAAIGNEGQSCNLGRRRIGTFAGKNDGGGEVSHDENKSHVEKEKERERNHAAALVHVRGTFAELPASTRDRVCSLGESA